MAKITVEKKEPMSGTPFYIARDEDSRIQFVGDSEKEARHKLVTHLKGQEAAAKSNEE